MDLTSHPVAPPPLPPDAILPDNARDIWVPRHDWPPTFRGKRVPADCRITEGALLVPADIAGEDQAAMEGAFRAWLWPPCADEGYRRYGREFHWGMGGRVLYYRILDVPARKGE